MPKEKLPHATDFENRTIDTWTTTTYLSYMKHLHQKYFDIPYQNFRGGIAAEKRLMKLAQNEMGSDDLKVLIDIAFDEYKPNPRFPNLSYGFIHTYMKPNIYARMMASKHRQQKAEERKALNDTGIDESWI